MFSQCDGAILHPVWALRKLHSLSVALIITAYWRTFQGLFTECHSSHFKLQDFHWLHSIKNCVHNRDFQYKNRGKKTWTSAEKAKTQFMITNTILVPKHNDDLKCVQSSLSAFCKNQCNFDLRTVIGFQLDRVSVFYSLVTHMYSLRTWLLVTSAGLTGQGRRYPLETHGLFWHGFLSVMASIHRLFMKGFTWKLQRLIGPWRSSLLLVLHGYQ